MLLLSVERSGKEAGGHGRCKPKFTWKLRKSVTSDLRARIVNPEAREPKLQTPY